ncbi:MAG: SIR2 family protein [Treponema sp.]
MEAELGNDKYLEILPQIRQIIWNKINEADRKILSDLLSNRDKYSGVLTLIKKFLEPHLQNINIITTNYDRLLEYVMTYHNINFTDGCSGRILSAFNEDVFKDKHIVNLIKVHGSLNWGKINNEIRYTDVFRQSRSVKISKLCCF